MFMNVSLQTSTADDAIFPRQSQCFRPAALLCKSLKRRGCFGRCGGFVGRFRRGVVPVSSSQMDASHKHVKADCEALLARFQQTQSVRFEVFANIWREMKFSQIFRGVVKHEKRAFCHLVLNTAYCYFLPPFSFQIRVGGLYLLYSLYYTQTASPSEQIHLALKDWEEVKKFENNAIDAQHMDAVYILRHLMFCKAFRFTAMPTLLCFQTNKVKERSVLREEFIERASRPQELISSGLLEEMSNVSDLYENMKASVLSQMTTPGDSSFNLIRKDLVSQLSGTVQEFYNWQREKETFDENENSQEDTSQKVCSNRAELLASIKSKAFGEAPETLKSRRHRRVEMNSTTEASAALLNQGYTRILKQSLRKRTRDALLLSGDVQMESASHTRISLLATLDSASKKILKEERS
uniref:Small nuclear RNA activating complex, polypeptide 1b n=3 Tax=Nothobranchius furzeri TaxID=105023 RepID=A0A8C6LWP3_NOTFU